MSDTFPSILPKEIEIESENANYSSESMSKKIQVINRNVHRFSISAKLNPLTDDQHNELSAFMDKQQGRFGIFEFPLMGVHANSSGTASGTPSTLDNNAGSKKVTFKIAIGKLSVGDFIRFSNHNKLYRVTKGTYTNTDSNFEIEVNPSLRVTLPEDTTVQIDDLSMRCSFESDSYKAKSTADNLHVYSTIKLVERA